MDEKASAHVAAIEVLKLEEVIMHIHKAEDYRAKYTESQECEDNVDLLVVNVVPVEKGIISWTLYVCISYTIPNSFQARRYNFFYYQGSDNQCNDSKILRQISCEKAA